MNTFASSVKISKIRILMLIDSPIAAWNESRLRSIKNFHDHQGGKKTPID